MALTQVPIELSSTPGIVDNSNATAITIDSSENVGIGTASPSKKFVISDGGAMGVEISPDDSGNGYSRIINYDRTTNQYEPLRIEGEILQFSTGTTATEKARLDASGNLLVGKTATAVSSDGVEVRNNGLVVATRNNNKAAIFNRRTSDGDILEFNKDSVAVGSIGTRGGDVYLETGDTGIRMYDQSDAIIPVGSTGISRDAAIDLGISTIRFKDLYLSGGIKTNNNTIDINSGSSNTVATFTSTDTEAQINLVDTTGSAQIRSRNDLRFYVNGGNTRAVDITSSGNVGINNANPTGKLHIGSGSSSAAISGSADELVLDNAGNAGITIATGSSAVASLFFADAASNASGYIQYTHSNDALAFATNNGTERMRIDSSGNLLVGKTASSATTAGHELRADGAAWHTADSTFPLFLNRETNDGELIRLRKDNGDVGSIGSRSSGQGVTFNSQGADGVLQNAGSDSYGWNAGYFYPRIDNTSDLGLSILRFNDAYITNGVTTGSDRNQKQDIETLSDAEQRVAVACKGLLRKWRWIDAVEAKGDDARIHFGIIAQDLQAAFEAEGLDAGRYAMFMSNTWTDEDTGEERTRLGVRYSELLAFIISAI